MRVNQASSQSRRSPLSNLIPEEHADDGDQDVVRDRADDDGTQAGAVCSVERPESSRLATRPALRN